MEPSKVFQKPVQDFPPAFATVSRYSVQMLVQDFPNMDQTAPTNPVVTEDAHIIEWLEYCRKYTWMALSDYGECLPAELLAECARREPWTALICVPHRLSEPLLVECARKRPYGALVYAGELLPPGLLAEFAVTMPETALEYCSDHMPPELADECRRLVNEQD